LRLGSLVYAAAVLLLAALFEAFSGAKVGEIIDDYIVTYMNYFGFTKDEPQYGIVSQVMTGIFAEMNGGRPVSGKMCKKPRRIV
jgi:hypothetical protein